MFHGTEGTERMAGPESTSGLFVKYGNYMEQRRFFSHRF